MKYKLIRTSLLVVPFVFLMGCSAMQQQGRPQSSVDAYVTDADEIVKVADWKKMQTITVTIEEHHYEPQNIVFKIGQPYKLELKNIGEKDHYYTAPEFLRSIATRKAMVNKQAEIKAPYFKAFEVLKKGGQVDVYFVPVVQGQYKVYCTIDDHREKGMEGLLTIE
jgi:uncharacterized cupredoxin-like copper-binding protein